MNGNILLPCAIEFRFDDVSLPRASARLFLISVMTF